MKTKQMLITLTLFFSLPVLALNAQWTDQEQGKIKREVCLKEFAHPKFLSQKLNPTDASSDKFDFFYFTKDRFDSNKPSLIYIIGGPGAITKPTHDVGLEGFNQVFFHIRGAGCSALPQDNTFDRYLRTAFVLEDIELIRQDLGLTQWDLVFGSSYGSIVANRYAQKYPDRINKVILDGNAVDYQDRHDHSFWYKVPLFFEGILNKDRANQFKGLDQKAKKELVRKVSVQVKKAREINGFEYILAQKKFADPALITKYPMLKLGPAYFMALWYINYIGWNSVDDWNINLQNKTSLLVASSLSPGFFDEIKVLEAKNELLAAYKRRFEQTEDNASTVEVEIPFSSTRVFNVLETFEGFFSATEITHDPPTLGDFEKNKAHDKVGYFEDFGQVMLSPELIKQHVPTFSLHGTADGGTPIEGFYEVFAALGHSDNIFFEVTGGGHWYLLPQNCLKVLYQKFHEGKLKGELSALLSAKDSVCYLSDGFKILKK